MLTSKKTTWVKKKKNNNMVFFMQNYNTESINIADLQYKAYEVLNCIKALYAYLYLETLIKFSRVLCYGKIHFLPMP